MSEQWKAFEREVAAALGGARVVRADYGESAADNHIEDFTELKVDAKRYKRHAHHSLLKAVQLKYCKKDGDIPVLVTRENGRHLKVVSLPLEGMALLLEKMRYQRQRIEQLEAQLEIRQTAEGL